MANPNNPNEFPDQAEVAVPQPTQPLETEFLSSADLLSSIRQRIADRLPEVSPAPKHHDTVPGTYPPLPTHSPLETDKPKPPLEWD